eukprot:75442-Prymnesium_polylepis.2
MPHRSSVPSAALLAWSHRTVHCTTSTAMSCVHRRFGKWTAAHARTSMARASTSSRNCNSRLARSALCTTSLGSRVSTLRTAAASLQSTGASRRGAAVPVQATAATPGCGLTSRPPPPMSMRSCPSTTLASARCATSACSHRSAAALPASVAPSTAAGAAGGGERCDGSGTEEMAATDAMAASTAVRTCWS